MNKPKIALYWCSSCGGCEESIIDLGEDLLKLAQSAEIIFWPAAMDARFSVAVEDIQKVAIPVLRHRISTNFQAQAEGMSNEDIIERLIQEIPLPSIPKYEK